MSAALQVLKLGGSLITDKSRERTFRAAHARRLARVLAAWRGPLILAHGTGSYGKPAARRHGYLDGLIPRGRLAAAVMVEADLEELRGRLLRVLRGAGIPVFPLAAAALFRSRGGEVVLGDARPARLLLERGLVPVVAGGFVVDETGGFAVCSSDAIAAHLARALGAARLILATDQAGVLSGGRVLPVLREEDASGAAVRCEGDATGGMGGKVAAGFLAARGGVETLVIDGRDPALVAAALAGRRVPGTRLAAGPHARRRPRA